MKPFFLSVLSKMKGKHTYISWFFADLPPIGPHKHVYFDTGIPLKIIFVDGKSVTHGLALIFRGGQIKRLDGLRILYRGQLNYELFRWF